MSYNLGIAAGKIVIDASQAEGSFGKVEAAAKSLGQQVQAKVASVEEFGGKLQKVGAVGVGAFGIAVNAASKFESGLSAIRAVSGATAEEMELISAAALRIGKDTSFSASEAAQAMEELIKAGISVEDTLNGAADSTVALAAAGGISLPEAAQIASNAMNAFGVTAAELPKIVDDIAGAANASAIDIGDLGQSLSQVGAVANLSGVSFHDTAVAIAELGNAGIKGSDAGTSLKTFLTNLIPTTEKQAQKFRELGLQTFEAGKAMKVLQDNGVKPLGKDLPTLQGQLRKLAAEITGTKEGSAKAEKEYLKLATSTGVLKNQFFDAEGNIKSFGEVQEILQKSTEKLTAEQKLNTLETLFGTDALRAAAVFAKEGAEGFNALSTEMGKVSAADVAAERLNNLSGSVEELKGSFETALIVIGNIFLPIVRRVVDGVTSLVNIFNNLPSGVQTAIGAFLGFISIMAVVVGTLLTIIVPIALLIAKFIFLGPIITGVAGVFTAFIGAITGGLGIFAAFGAAFSAIGGIVTSIAARFSFFARILNGLRSLFLLFTGPVGIAIAIITGLALLGKLLYDNFEPFRRLVDSIAAVFTAKFGPAIEQIRIYFEAFVNILKSTVEPSMNRIKTALASVVPVLLSVGRAVLDKILPHLRRLGADIGGLVAAFQRVTGPGTTFSNVIGAIGSFIDTKVIPALLRFRSFLAANLLPAFATVVEFITGTFLPIFLKVAGFFVGIFLTSVINGVQGVIQAISGAFNIIIGVFNFFKALFTGDWSGMWDAIKQIVGGVADLIVGIIRAWLNLSILKVFGVGLGLIKAIFTKGWQALRGIVTGATSAISSGISAVFTAIRSFFSTIFNAIRGVFTSAFNSIRGTVQSSTSSVQSVITSIFNAIRNYFTGVLTFYRTLFTTIFTAIRTFVATALQGLSASITLIFNTIRAFFTTVLNGIRTVFTTVFNAIRTVVTTVINGIRSTVSSVMSGISSAISTALNAIRSTFTTIWNALKGIVVSAFNGIKGAVSSGISGFMGLIRGIPGQITGALGNLSSLLFNAGKSIITGLINGVKSAIGALKSTLSGITGLIPDFKGPPKTDAILLEANGELIMGGLIRGIESQIRPLARTLADVTTSIPGSVRVDANPLAGVSLASPVAAPAPAATVQNYYSVDRVEIPASDLAEMRDINDFFNRIQQEARRRAPAGAGSR